MLKQHIVFIVLAIILLVTMLAALMIAFLPKHAKAAFGDNAMVIVEPRKHPLLQPVIDNFHKNMDLSWDLYVFHGKSHKNHAKSAVKNTRKTSRKVFVLPLTVDNLIGDDYSTLLKQSSFWDRVHAENILVFQTDTVLCANAPKSINQFIKFPYIGCAYNDTEIGAQSRWGEHKFYGVGGLSFRKKTFMMDCILKNPDVPTHVPEDVFFSDCAHATSDKPSSALELSAFCTQNTFVNKSFGAHKLGSELNKQQVSEFIAYCPEASILL
jgi:hypothetical protein